MFQWNWNCFNEICFMSRNFVSLTFPWNQVSRTWNFIFGLYFAAETFFIFFYFGGGSCFFRDPRLVTSWAWFMHKNSSRIFFIILRSICLLKKHVCCAVVASSQCFTRAGTWGKRWRARESGIRTIFHSIMTKVMHKTNVKGLFWTWLTHVIHISKLHFQFNEKQPADSVVPLRNRGFWR